MFKRLTSFIFFLLPLSAFAQDASVGAALRSLASRSENAFVGQVSSITRHGGVVEIVFAVDHAVIGNVASSYTLREWAGLWPLGSARYWVGERALVFLPSSSAAGLSSPVDGPEGVVPVVTASDGATALVDVRLLATRVERTLQTALSSVSVSSYLTLSDAEQVASSWSNPTWTEPGPPPVLPLQPPAPKSSSTVLGQVWANPRKQTVIKGVLP